MWTWCVGKFTELLTETYFSYVRTIPNTIRHIHKILHDQLEILYVAISYCIQPKMYTFAFEILDLSLKQDIRNWNWFLSRKENYKIDDEYPTRTRQNKE